MIRKRIIPGGDGIEDQAASWVFRLDAGLSAEERAEFDRWRAADARHEEALERQQRAWSLLDRPRCAGQAGLLLRRISAEKCRRRRFAVAAVSILLLLAAGTFLRRLPHSGADPGAPGASVVLPASRILADGSVVELRPGTEIDVDLGGPQRRVALRKGEAHFQVAREGRPFVVAAGAVEFRAVGTGFSVHLADTEVELIVTEGRVAVGRPGAVMRADSPSRNPEPESCTDTIATVDAGSRLVIDAEGTASIPGPVAVASDELAERLAWRAPRLEFTDTPLAEAVALMNRYNRVQFVIPDAGLARLPVSGLFRADRTEAMVRILEANFGVEAERSGGTILLRRGR